MGLDLLQSLGRNLAGKDQSKSQRDQGGEERKRTVSWHGRGSLQVRKADRLGGTIGLILLGTGRKAKQILAAEKEGVWQMFRERFVAAARLARAERAFADQKRQNHACSFWSANARSARASRAAAGSRKICHAQKEGLGTACQMPSFALHWSKVRTHPAVRSQCHAFPPSLFSP